MPGQKEPSARSDSGSQYWQSVAWVGIQVADALAHAASQGILHRDIKPSNLLLDETGNVWVTDFGLAKAASDSDNLTHTGDVIGTLRYLAPERFNGQGDVRSDVYSLGLTLYELLVLRPAFDEVERSKLVKQVMYDEPARPRKLNPTVPRDLETVVLKAIARDPAHRYQSPADMADDLKRFVEDRPVRARRASEAEKLWRWCRRNPLPASLLAAVLLVFLTGFAGTTWGLIEARRQEKIARDEATEKERARQAEAEQRSAAEVQKEKALQAAAAEKSANQQAQKRLTQVEKANEILGSIFENLDPKEIAKAERPLQAILVEKLDKAVAQLEGESIGDPLVVAAMQVKFGNSLVSLGEYGKAIVLLEKARATRQARLGPDHPDTLLGMDNLAWAYQYAGKHDLALQLHQETLKLRKAKLGPEHPDTLNSMGLLALAYVGAGKYDLALPLLEETLALRKAKLGPDHPDILAGMNNLAFAYQNAGKLDLALPLLEEALKLRKTTLGPDHPDTLGSMNNLAAAYRAAGKLDLALPLFEETLKLRRARLGPDHPDTLGSMNNLAAVYQGTGKLDLALPLLEETVKLRKARLGPDHPSTLFSMNNLAATYWSVKQLDKSIPLFEEALKGQEAKLGRDHPDTLMTLANLGVNYRDAGRLAEAIPLLEEAQRAVKKYPTLGWVAGPLLDAYARAGETNKIADFVREELPKARKTFDSRQLARLLTQIGSSLLEQKKWLEAEPHLRESLAFREKKEPDAWTTFETQLLLGRALLGQKRYADAEPLLLAGYVGLKKRESKLPPQGKIRLTEALERLVELYTATNKPDEVNKWQAERAKHPAAAPPLPEKK
jgi:tetratricopeptide (TPR) repeat protein